MHGIYDSAIGASCIVADVSGDAICFPELNLVYYHLLSSMALTAAAHIFQRERYYEMG